MKHKRLLTLFSVITGSLLLFQVKAADKNHSLEINNNIPLFAIRVQVERNENILTTKIIESGSSSEILDDLQVNDRLIFDSAQYTDSLSQSLQNQIKQQVIFKVKKLPKRSLTSNLSVNCATFVHAISSKTKQQFDYEVKFCIKGLSKISAKRD